MKRMWMLSIVLGIALLAGCSGGGDGATYAQRSRAPAAEGLKAALVPADADKSVRAVPSQPGEAGGAAAAAPTPASTDGLSSLPTQRMVIKTAALAVRVRDVPAAFARAIQLAEAGGGYVQSSTQSDEGGERADVTIRVPLNGFLPLLASLGALGAVTTRTISGEDVTQEYYDLDAELGNQVEVRGRLLQLLKQAVKVQDAISVEEQLERVGANVNRIKGR